MRATQLSVALSLLLATALTPVSAQDSASYSWERPQGAAAATLTLRGADGDRQLSFAADQPVQISAGDLTNGAYKWELVYSPQISAAQSEASRQRREAGDIDTPSDWPQAIAVRSGMLQVNGGRFVSPLSEAEPAPKPSAAGVAKAAPIAGDQTIRTSACIGNDCVDFESYGSDTLRLKENNLRIHFDDTSNTGSFPDNDWRIAINGTNNGDPNFFAIQDATFNRTPFLIEAGSINNALYVDAAGDVGIGTDAPVVELHAVDGNTPTLRLDQNGSNGFTPYIWDVAGNEANFFIRDVNTGRLPFKIRPGAGESSVDIAGTGNVGFGLVNASAALHIRRNFASSYLLVERTNGDRRMELDNDGNLYVGGTITQLSSRHSKENLVAVAGSALLDQLRNLDLWTWNYISAPDADRHIGPVAEDFYAAFGLGTSDQSLAPGDVAGVALAASQALSEEIAQRDAKIATLEERIARLEAALEQISSAQR